MTNINTCINCMGCSACSNICPQNAISMQEDVNGFMQPVIDENKCTDCGLCENVCPSLNPDFPNTNSPKFYAAMATDKLRNGKSSSGAIFPAIAKAFLNTGGGGEFMAPALMKPLGMYIIPVLTTSTILNVLKAQNMYKVI